MGIQAILAALRSGVNTCPVVTWQDRGFRCHDGPRETSPYPWIQSPDRQLRDATIGLTALPIVDACPRRTRAVLGLQVAYPLSEPDDLLVPIIAEDCARLGQRLVGDNAYWGGADAIWQADAPTADIATDPDGHPSHYVVTIPLTLWWTE